MVLQIVTRLIVGGAQLTVLEVCKGLAEDFEMHVLCGPEEGAEGSIRPEVASVAPVAVVPELRRNLNPANDLRALVALRRAIRRLSPDLVHTHSSKAGILGRLAAAWAGVPAVHTIHGWGHTPGDSAIRRAALVSSERAVARRTKALLAVSEEVKQEGIRLGIGSPSQYEIVPECVDLRSRVEDFGLARERARASLGLSDDERIVGWVGRFVPQKDPACLAETLGRILGERRELRAVLVGDGPLRGLVEERVDALGVRDRVVFAGLRPDARQLYPAFDVLLHVSRWEGQPRVVQEAVAERIPVVASRASGVADFVVAGRTGFMVEPGDAAGLATRTLEVVANGELRAPLDRDAVAEIAARSGREVSLSRHAEIYRGLV